MDDELAEVTLVHLSCNLKFQYSLLLEVRQGDDLYQVAHWHCHKHSLGFERAGALSEQLERVRSAWERKEL